MNIVHKVVRFFRVHTIISVCSLCLIFLAGGIFLLQSTWGIRGKYYTNTEWDGPPDVVIRDDIPYVRGNKGISEVPSEAFSVKWQGWIVIETPGEYEFITDSDDGSFLSIDKTRIVDNGGAHGPQRKSGKVFLEQGPHHFEVLYFSIGGASLCEVLWIPPEQAEHRIPPEVFFAKRPTAAHRIFRTLVLRWKDEIRLILLSLGIMLILLLPLIGLLKIFKTSSRTLIFSGILLLVVLVGVESLSWIFFTVFQKEFTFFDLEYYLVSEELQEQMLHAQLSDEKFFKFGWDMNYQTPYGERPRATSYGSPLLSSYGDSFTHCDEVEDEETWQEYLSELVQMDVYNFGVGGYGTDQAYLKYLSEYANRPTPIVVLGLITENINRIVNVYRPFYFPRTAGRATKPRFVLKNGELVLIENPVRRKSDVAKLGDLQFIQQIGKNDWWYNRDDYPILRFPYSKILLNKRMWLEIFYGRANRKINDIDPRPWEDLWETEDARALMFAIFDAFVKDVRAHGAQPVIMIFPLKHQVDLKFRTGEHDSRVTRIMEYCEQNAYDCFETITPLAEKADSHADIDSFFGGHVSAKGNRLIAEAFYQYLEKRFPDLLRRS